MLRDHGRYDYSAITDRPDYQWPGGKRLAVYIGLNLEHFAFGEGLGAELAPGGPPPDILNYAWRDYGNRVGAWRMLDMFDRLDMPVSVIANSAMYAYAPELMAAHRARGDEILGHGRTNSERQSTLDKRAETDLIAEATRILTEAEGKAPKGWLSPWIAESLETPDLLTGAGYRYTLNWCMDDQPIWMRTENGPVLSIPYPQEANDIPSIVARKDGAVYFADMIIDNFDEMLEQSAAQPLVMGIALHPYLVGQPYRLRHLRRALTHINAHRDRIWLTRSGDIFDDCAARVNATAEAQLPRYKGADETFMECG
ncbi:polysaccharide deacetylase family protein [Roseobacter weihaiensis]|uniref:polysaccharide deacetylase family protein n=1 Tax=Roseobacter weihaiensis TaxID=2763262 RepID=UPI001D0A8913|nr:polysaccharide deacetylase family protein [Roseobacter sp. H9]